MMRMLHRGGMEVFADNHAGYEHGLLNGPTVISVHQHHFAGKAAKVLDPHHHTWPRELDARVIWLDRDTREQAKSQVKFLRMIGGFTIPGQSWRAMAKSLPGERAKSMDIFERLHVPVLELRFEDVLANPVASAMRVNDFVGGLSISAMAECVIPRSPKCAPDVAIEVMLSEQETRRIA